MNITVKGSNYADAYLQLNGAAGMVLLRLETFVWAGISTGN
jgi:hypothetical protein